MTHKILEAFLISFFSLLIGFLTLNAILLLAPDIGNILGWVFIGIVGCSLFGVIWLFVRQVCFLKNGNPQGFHCTFP